MLSMPPKSRARILSGAAAIGVLVLTGLGITASGTQAAEGLRSSVGKTIGVDLSSAAHLVPVAATAPVALVRPAVAVAPAVQDDATLPPLPAPPVETNDPMPPVPPALPVPAVAGDRTIQRVRMVRDGKVIGDDVMADMPEVISQNCHGGGKDEMVINDHSGGKNRIIICTDRIEKAAAAGAEMAARSGDIERNAYRSALSGLQGARSNVLADSRLSAEARSDAITSIDDSIKELQDDLADAGKDR